MPANDSTPGVAWSTTWLNDGIMDFAAITRGLIIEVDGDNHAGNEARDERRTAALEARGLNVIPAFASGLDARPAIEQFFMQDGASRVQALVSLTGFWLVRRGLRPRPNTHDGKEKGRRKIQGLITLKPTSSITFLMAGASMRAASNSTVTCLVSKTMSVVAMPSVASSAFLSRPEHPPHFIPSTVNAVVVMILLSESQAAAGVRRRRARQRLSSSELLKTETELKAMAAPAMTGSSNPNAASGMPSTL